MSQRLFSPRLEATVIRSITSSDDRVAGWLFPRINKTMFSYDPSQEFYHRVSLLTSKRGMIPRWDDLLEDLSISRDARDDFAGISAGVISTRREAKLVLERLDEYRKARVFFGIQKDIANALRSDRVDLEVLGESIGEKLSSARSSGTLEDSVMHFGGRHLDKRGLMELLRDTGDEFIPTGFHAFDTQSQGVPRGSAFVVAGPTGSGKSMIATNLAVNQARFGAKVSLTSLEMGRLAVNRRIISILTAIPLSEINRVHQMDKTARRMLIEAWRDFDAQVRNNGGRLTIFTPDEDLSIEELLTFLRGRGYDNNIIDYMGLLKGMDGDDQWRKLGAGARYAKRYTAFDNSICTLLAQLSDEGEIRYSKAIQEHASLMWKWMRPDESNILTIRQPKSRNQRSFDFPLQLDYSCMRVSDVDMSLVAVQAGAQNRVSDRKAIAIADGRESKGKRREVTVKAVITKKPREFEL